MTKKTAYEVRLHRQDTGEEKTMLCIATDPERAGANAIERMRRKIPVMADRKYAPVQILSCTGASGH